MRANKASDTGPERAVRSALHRLGLRYRKNVRPVPTLRCRADIVFSRARVAVFIDGCFWHSCPSHGVTPRTNSAYWIAKIERNRERDLANNAELNAAGWAVVRVWEHEDPDEAARRVATALRDYVR